MASMTTTKTRNSLFGKGEPVKLDLADRKDPRYDGKHFRVVDGKLVHSSIDSVMMLQPAMVAKLLGRGVSATKTSDGGREL